MSSHSSLGPNFVFHPGSHFFFLCFTLSIPLLKTHLLNYSHLLTYLPSPLDSELLVDRDNIFSSLCSQKPLLGLPHSSFTISVEILHLVLGIGCLQGHRLPTVPYARFWRRRCTMLGKTWSLAPRIYNLIRETSPFYGKDVIKNQCILELNMRQEKAWCGRTRIGLE